MHCLLEVLTTSKLNYSFCNVELALKLFISIPRSYISRERFFSVLKRVKNYQRMLALISIENNVVRCMKCNDIINEFAAQKARKIYI